MPNEWVLREHASPFGEVLRVQAVVGDTAHCFSFNLDESNSFHLRALSPPDAVVSDGDRIAPGTVAVPVDELSRATINLDKKTQIAVCLGPTDSLDIPAQLRIQQGLDRHIVPLQESSNRGNYKALVAQNPVEPPSLDRWENVVGPIPSSRRLFAWIWWSGRDKAVADYHWRLLLRRLPVG